jgi:NAD(P)-dependent dehydrogenase (short-subunit alcohol dehydrogenase family)
MSLPASESGRPVSSELAGQVALITGAAHGQGRATALALAREGVHKLILDAGLLTR